MTCLRVHQTGLIKTYRGETGSLLYFCMIEVCCPVCGRLGEVSVVQIEEDKVLDIPSCSYAEWICPGCKFSLRSKKCRWNDFETNPSEGEMAKDVVDRLERMRTLDRREVLIEGYLSLDIDPLKSL